MTVPAPSAETVLLSSGLGGAAGYWAPQLDALRPALSRRRLRPGRHRPHRRRAAGRPQHRRHGRRGGCRARCQRAPPTAHFVGHALGGLVGLALAQRQPERLRSLTVVNGWAAVHSPHPALLRRAPGAAEARRTAGLRACPADLPLSRRLAGAERGPRGAGRGARPRRLPGRQQPAGAHRRPARLRCAAGPRRPSSCRPSSSRRATMCSCRASCRRSSQPPSRARACMSRRGARMRST